MTQLTEDDLKTMSPEQIRQLQKQQCIFCHIIAKRVQARIIFEDDKVTAVLDINPANPGHILLLPKEHFSVSPQMPDELIAHMGIIAKQLSKAMLRAVGAEGTTVLAANGLAAGQRASHFMMHVIPRKEKDGVGIALPPGEINERQLFDIQRQLSPIVAKAFGAEPIKVPEVKDEKPVEEIKTEKKLSPGTQIVSEQKAAPQPKTLAPDDDDAPETNLDDITSFLLGGK